MRQHKAGVRCDLGGRITLRGTAAVRCSDAAPGVVAATHCRVRGHRPLPSGGRIDLRPIRRRSRNSPVSVRPSRADPVDGGVSRNSGHSRQHGPARHSTARGGIHSSGTSTRPCGVTAGTARPGSGGVRAVHGCCGGRERPGMVPAGHVGVGGAHANRCGHSETRVHTDREPRAERSSGSSRALDLDCTICVTGPGNGDRRRMKDR